ncbi:esterase-like activity of phytase family protein [Aurantiacibacter marinus]|uniref:esterase-like activity of phytase family protein n=1 Tax=Aurantiacibacter marinus TaxID=874156 RepID=UPI0006997145|nr:esterase-like activity of phytase family protein [Aurantiacibacter marinus]
MARSRNFPASRKRRIAAAAALAIMLAPGTFLRTAIPVQRTNALYAASVEDLPDLVGANGFTREGVWHLTSPNIDFGGFSALLVLEGAGRLRSFSDRGSSMTFVPPDDARDSDVRFGNVWNRGRLSKDVPDIEAATRDPATGDYWVAFENGNSVIRYSRSSAFLALREPPEWSDWAANSGAEAMERLPDGRFLVLPESSRQGLLHPGDPTLDTEAMRFSVALPGDFAPTDLSALPDGRVLVLLRRVAVGWPPFTAALGIADPRSLDEGGVLDVDLVLELASLVPRENYEGLAVEQRPDGAYTVWLIADDNLASFQRTLLVKLGWDGAAPSAHEKAREE